MRRPLVLVPLIAAVLACAALAADAAVAAAPKPAPSTGVFIEGVNLQRRIGHFIVSVQVEEDDEVLSLAMFGHPYSVLYGTEDWSLEGKTLTARFGGLGSLYLTLESPLHHAKGCGHRTENGGPLKGEFEFHGEGGYLDFDLHSMPGEADVISGLCPRGVRPRPARATDQEELEHEEAVIEHHEREEEERKEIKEPHATLAAVTRGPLPREGVSAIGVRDLHNKFTASVYAYRYERGEGMFVERIVGAGLGRARFKWDFAHGTALVRPPAPFTGSATYTRRPGGGARWSGNLQVPTLGGPRLFLTGKRFKVRLSADLPHDE